MAFSPFALCLVIVLVCLILAIAVASAYERAGYGIVNKQHLWKTCHSSIHYGWLLGLRIVALIYCLAVLMYDIVLWGPFIFEYYTQWTFTLLIVYFGIATVSSVRGIRYERNLESTPQSVLENNQNLLSGYNRADVEEGAVATLRSTYYKSAENAGWDGYLMQILFQIVLGATFVTDVVYWACIYPNYPFLDVIVISMHAVNLVFLIADVALSNMVFYWFRGAYFFMWTVVFIFFSWTIHALGEKQWPYTFLDVSVSLAPLWYFLLCLVHFFAYGLVCGLMYLKTSCLRRFQPSMLC